ncbi:MAG: hypothetical protein ACR2MO_09060 [Acidimicrobiales bacterium]
MQTHRIAKLRGLEGLQIGLSLADGSRIDDATLVSAGAGRTGTVWLFSGGADVFVPAGTVVDVWEWSGVRAA